MNPNRQVFFYDTSAPATRLGGVGRVHGNNGNTSTFSLVFKHLPEEAKPCVIRGQSKVTVLFHKAEGKVLDCHQVVLDNKPGADFMQVIRSLIGNPFVQTGYLTVGFLLAFTSLDLTGDMLLKGLQFRKAFPQPSGIIDQLTGRESSQAFQSNVNADLVTRRGLSRLKIGQFEHQAYIPAVVDQLDNGVLDFCLGRDWSVKTHPYFVHILNVERFAPVFVLAQLATVPVGILDTVKTVTAFEAGKAGLLSCLQTSKKSSKRLVQSAQEMLQARCVDLSERVWRIMAHISKMRPLCSVAIPHACFPPADNPLFEGSIVDQARLPKQIVQLCSLLGIGAKEVLVGAKHSLT